YHKFRTYFFLRNLFFEIELIKKLTKEYKSVIYYTNSTYLSDLTFSSGNVKINLKTKSNQVNYLTLINYSIFFIVRLFLTTLHLKKLKYRKHIIIDHANKQSCLNLKTLMLEPGNYNLKYLFEKTDDDFLIIDDVEIPKFSTKGQNYMRKYFFKIQPKRIFSEFILARGLISSKIRKKLHNFSSSLQSIYNQIEPELENQDDKLIFSFIKSLHNSSRLYLFKYLSYKQFFKRFKFKTISSIDENSPRIKTILDAAKYQNIKTIGIQHGTIHELHPAYVYYKNDSLRNIVPDKTIVWGDNWLKFLVSKGNYRKESVYVAGQIRTDIIPKLLETKSKNPFIKSENESIIVFASQPQRDPVLRERAAMDVCNAVNNIKNSRLIIKLHPAEKNDYSYYENIAKKSNCKNYQIILNFDLYLLISLSDIIITCFSTVGAETVYFNKPLIILDHLKQDIQNYHKDGIALQATNSKELKHHIEMILSGNTNIDKTAYKNYILKNAYKIDGKVSERIIQFIRSL
ncbi:MAG: CDP-glycerol glycerophosphotransferase family protein, partial [Bacteroidales bacterium]|nr:CDP-glycerol glycerophosphotransferase family protein [Bacteroidales bacterium]